MADWPLPPLIEPPGAAGDDEDVVRAYVRGDTVVPHSELFHVEGPVLMAGRDLPTALRTGPRSFLINHDMYGGMAKGKEIAEAVFTAEGLSMLDEDTLYGAAVGVQLVGLRYSTWDLWGADIEQAFADLRIAAAGGEEDLMSGGADTPFS